MLLEKGAAVLRPYEEQRDRARQKAPASEGGRYKEARWRSRGLRLRFGVERFGNNFAVGFSEQDFYFAFGFLELFLAFAGESHAFFEEFHGVVEGKLRAFEFADDFFEAREGALEIGFLGWIGFFGSRCVHVFFAGNSLRQGGERKQGGWGHAMVFRKKRIPRAI